MKSVTDELPRVKNRKKIDVKEFAKLAKKVRDIFEEEKKLESKVVMDIVLQPDFLSIVRNKYLLLDTNVFIDASLHPESFGAFFNQIRDAEGIIVTPKIVAAEFIKGAENTDKFNKKKIFVNSIIDTFQPVTPKIFDHVVLLTEKYKEDGKTTSIVDLILGGLMVEYPNRLFLLTKDIKDFPENVFCRTSFITLLHRKAIQSYGLYTYPAVKKS